MAVFDQLANQKGHVGFPGCMGQKKKFREGFRGRNDVGDGDFPVSHSSDDLGRSGM